MPVFKDITGRRFGRLVAVSHKQIVVSGRKSIVWHCVCDCGNTKTVSLNALNFSTSSCGCFRREATKKAFTTHGKNRTPIYIAWTNMKKRCSNTTTKDYKNYGGRGVTVCTRWINSFENFYADMGEKPKGKSLDRKDNNGNYSPDNCKWSTRTEQNRNSRSNRYVSYQGKTMIITDWSRALNIPIETIRARLNKNWPTEKVLTMA